MTNSNQIIEEGLKTFDKKFEEHPEDEIIYATLLEIKSFFRTFAEKIYKEAREKEKKLCEDAIRNYCVDHTDCYKKIREEVIEEVRKALAEMRKRHDLTSKLGMGYNEAVSDLFFVLKALKE